MAKFSLRNLLRPSRAPLRRRKLQMEQLLARKLLAADVNLGIVRPDAAHFNDLQQFKLDTTGDATPESEFHFGFSVNSAGSLGVADVTLVGDFDNVGFDQAVAVRQVAGQLEWFGDTDRDTDQEYHFTFGTDTDTPLIADMNGDGYDDVIAVDTTTMTWYVHHAVPGLTPYPTNNPAPLSVDAQFQFGIPGDVPLLGDFFGDARADLATVRVNGQLLEWRTYTAVGADYPNNAPTEPPLTPDATNYTFGLSAAHASTFADDIPVVGDWDNSGNDNFGVVREGNGSGASTWYLDTNFDSTADISRVFGVFGDQYVVGIWAERYWDGTGNSGGDGTNWHDPFNWSDNTLPGGGDDVVIIQPGVGASIELNSGSHTIGTLTGRDGSALRVTGGSLTVNDSYASTSNVNVAGGTLRLDGPLSAADLELSSGTLEIGEDEVIVATPFTANGGTIFATGTGTKTLSNDFPIFNTITLDGSQTLHLAGVVSGSGGFNTVGTTRLSAANTYSGLTTIGPSGRIVLDAGATLGSTAAGTTVDGGRLQLGLNAFNDEPVTLTGAGADIAAQTQATQAGDVILATTGQARLQTIAGGTLDVTGDISGTAGFLQLGAAALADSVLLSGTNTYDAPTVLQGSGQHVFSGGNAIPDISRVESNSSGGFALTSSESIGSLAGVLGTTIDIGGNTLEIGGDGTTDAAFEGNIIGTGNLVKSGTGTQTILRPTSYQGATTISGGTMNVYFAGTLGDAGPGNPAKATRVQNGARLALGALTHNEEVILEDGATLSGDGAAFQNGDITLEPNASVTFEAFDTFDTVEILSNIAGGLGGSIAFNRGTFRLTGFSVTYSGSASVNDGTLIVDGDFEAPITVASGATLAGNGITLGVNVLDGGTVSPGTSPGALFASDWTFNDGSVTQIELGGATFPPVAGSDHDVIDNDPSGDITLGATAALQLALVDNVTAGLEYTIVSNNGANPIQGGSFVSDLTAGPVTFTADYAGGDGNDLVLTATSTTDFTKFWDGEGGDYSWQNPLNWSGDTLPGPSDRVMIDAFGDQTITSTGSVTIDELYSNEQLRIDSSQFFLTSGTIESLDFVNGLFDVSGIVQLMGTSFWRDGSINATAGELENYGTLNIEGSSVDSQTLVGFLTNYGTINHTAADLNLFDGAFLTNDSNAVYDLQSGNIDKSLFAFPTFYNDGTLLKSGPGTSSVNVLLDTPGFVDVIGGTLSLDDGVSQIGLDELQGGFWYVDDGATLLIPGALSLNTNFADVTLRGTGSFPKFDTVTANNVGGMIRLEAGHTFSAGLNFTNAGALFVDPQSHFATVGSYTQTSGSTVVNGNMDVLAFFPDPSLIDISGGTIGGGGDGVTTGFIAADSISVGNGSGAIELSGGGFLTLDNPLTLDPTSRTSLVIGGTTPGTDYMLLVTEDVPILDGELEVAEQGTIQAGQDYLLIDNTSPAPITSQFSGLPEGAAFPVAGNDFTITYQGGDGNDVVLLAQSDVLWDGGAGTFNWFDAANWQNDTLPGPTATAVIGDLASPVIIDGPNTTVAGITSQESLSFDGGVFTVTDSVDVTGANVTLGGGQLIGGNWTVTGGSFTADGNTNNRITDVTINGDVDVTGYLEAYGTNDWNELLLSVGFAQLHLEPGSTLTSDVSAIGTTGVSRFVTVDGIGTATIGSGVTMRTTAAAVLFVGDTSETFINQGTISQEGPGATIIGSNFTNAASGEVAAASGDLVFDFTPSNYSSGTLSGGSWTTSGNGVIRFPTGDAISNIAADVEVGSTGNGIEAGSSVNALSTLTTVDAVGELTIGSANTQTLPNVLTNNGILTVDGTLNAPGVTLESGSILFGQGIINAPVQANAGATVAPGNSPGILTTGNLSFGDGSTFEVEIGGPNPGNTDTDHDQIAVTGTVNIGNNVTLNLTSWLGYTPSGGEVFVIIDNDGTIDGVSGTFDSLPEGATLTNFLGSGLDATLTYMGGDGNDVVVTMPAIATLTSVELSVGDLVIEDTSGANVDTLVISTTPTDVVISDTGGNDLSTTIPGALGDGSPTITVPKALIGDSRIVVNTAGEDDSVAFDPFFDPGPGFEVLVDAGPGTDVVNWDSSFAIQDIDITAEDTLLSSDVTTSGGQGYDGNVVVSGSVAVIADSVTITGDINDAAAGTSNLAIGLSAPGSSIGGAIGSVDPLNSLSVNGELELSGGAVSTTGDQQYLDRLTLSAATTFAGDNVSFNGLDVNAASWNVLATGVLTLDGIIDDDFTGPTALSADGNVVMNAGLRFNLVNSDLSVTSTNGDIDMADGAVIDSGDGSVTLVALGDVTIGQVVASFDAQVTSTNGSINDGGSAGVEFDVNELSLSAANGIGASGSLEVLAGTVAAVSSSNDIRFGFFAFPTSVTVGTVGSVSGLTAADGDISIFFSDITVDQPISSPQGDIALTADTFQINETLSATGRLSISPDGIGTSIGIGDGASGTLNLDGSEIANFIDGFAEISIGGGDAGTADVQAVTFTDPVEIDANEIFINGDLVGADDATITLKDTAGSSTTHLAADIITEGNAVVIDDVLMIDSGFAFEERTIDTTAGGVFSGGADVQFLQTVDTGSFSGLLAVDAGSGGNVLFSLPVGDDVSLDSLSVSAGSVDLTSDVFAVGDIHISATGSIVQLADTTLGAEHRSDSTPARNWWPTERLTLGSPFATE